MIRRLFIAPPGHWFAGIDLSAIDARSLAHGLLELFGDGSIRDSLEKENLPENIKKRAELVSAFGPSSPEVKAFMASIEFHQANADLWDLSRGDSKTAIYAISFGVGATKLGKGDKEKGQAILDAVAEKTPAIQKLKEYFWNEARRTGKVETALGRRFDFTEYKNLSSGNKWKNRGALGRLERQIFSCYVQGTSADVFKILTCRAATGIHRLGGRIAAAVHDELIVYFPDSVSREDGLAVLNDALNCTDLLLLPVRAQSASGENWKDCH